MKLVTILVSSIFSNFSARATWMTLKCKMVPDFLFISLYVPYFAEHPGELHLSSPSRWRLSPSQALTIIDSLWALYILLTAGKTYPTCKLLYVVSLRKLRFAISILSFIFWNQFPESNIQLVMDIFPEVIPWSSCWKYQQVSQLSSHSNETIRRTPFSVVLVLCAGFLHSGTMSRFFLASLEIEQGPNVIGLTNKRGDWVIAFWKLLLTFVGNSRR